jgi:hypothetical protein
MFNDMNKIGNIFFAGVETLLNQNNQFCFKQFVAKYGTPVLADTQFIQGLNANAAACYAVGDTVCTFIFQMNGKDVDFVILAKNTEKGKRYYLGNQPATYPAYLAVTELLSDCNLQFGSFFPHP